MCQAPKLVKAALLCELEQAGIAAGTADAVV
jgi:hypothetical protein